MICTVVGIACWFGKPNTNEHSTNTTTKPFLPGTAPWENLYLPSYTVPKHYDLTLHPDFYEDNAKFYGNVTIEIDVKQATWHLLVHIKKLDVEGMLYK